MVVANGREWGKKEGVEKRRDRREKEKFQKTIILKRN